ncbi:MAG TPA: hypothetical protein VNV66_08305 [Pilimelia sp.]|nr:hypothetical protein [Pilimelia sp.]
MVVKAVARVLAITALTTVAACGPAQDAGTVTPSYTYAEAVKTVDDSLRDAARRFTPKPELRIAGAGEVTCAGPNDDKPTDQVMYERAYWLRKIPSAQNSNIVNQLKRYWQDNDYVIRIEELYSHPKATWTLAARSRATGFKMKLTRSTTGELSLSAQSPCVKEPERPKNLYNPSFSPSIHRS